MRVLIVGGLGEIGKALASNLRSQAIPATICVLSRTGKQADGDVRVMTGNYADLAPSLSFQRELANFDAVVHLADGLAVLQERETTLKSSLADALVDGSRRLAQAVRLSHVPLFLYLSSIKAITDEDDARILVESSTPQSTRLYGLTKLRLEQTIADVLVGSDTRCVSVRSPVVYGRRGRGSLMQLLKLADTPYPLPLGGLTNKRSIVSVQNLANALMTILKSPPLRDGVYHVHDGAALSTTQIVELFRCALGRKRMLISMPAATTAMLLKLHYIGPICRRLYGSLQISDAKFRQTFGWDPVESSHDALTEMAVNARLA